MVARRLERHDANQLELKLAYPLDPTRRWQRYAVEAWIFVPRTLGLTRSSYPRERFFEDTAAFVRLKTPTVALRALGDEGLSAEWFDSVLQPLRAMLGGATGSVEAVSHRLRLLGCIYRRSIDDEAKAVLRRFAEARGLPRGATQDRAVELARRMTRFHDETAAAMGRLRALAGSCEQAALDPRVTDVWRAVDEFVALVAEEALTELVQAADELGRATDCPPLVAAREVFADAAIEVYRYRRGRAYPSQVRPGARNEELPYRAHVLKRIVSSALFLQVREAEPGQLATNLIGALAAALAMLFAVVVTLWAQGTFEMASLAFVTVAVASYIVKDRLKEAAKRVLGKRVAKYLPDKVMDVREGGTGALLGRVQEAVRVGDPRDLSPEIVRLRYLDHQTTTATTGRPETVIRYFKQVTLWPDAIQRHVEGVNGVSDIIRFNINRLRQRMDDPVETRLIVDPTTRKIVAVDCARVYHVNLILKFTKGRGRATTTELERARVVIDRTGIQRVERVGASATGVTLGMARDSGVIDE